MKKKVKNFFLLLFFACTTNLFSQPPKLNTKVSYGNFTQDQFFKVKSQVIPSTSSRGEVKSKGALFISFNRPVSGFILAGAALGTNKLVSDIISNNQKTGILNRTLFTLAIESDIIYFKSENVQLYAVLGYGYTLGKDEYFFDTGETGSGFIGFMAFQVSPVSIKVGNRFGLFAETGFGYKGIINFGFTYNF